MAPPSLYPGAAVIATLLSIHGFRKGSLSLSGAVAAWVVGYVHLANPVKVFGVGLIFFYLAGSRATKIKADAKAKLEDGPDPSKPGGNRNAVQVLSNSLPSFCAALSFRFLCSPAVDLSKKCVLDDPLHRSLIYLALGQLATNFADTLASELGILAAVKPIHVFTLRPVPAGTNGGVTPHGLMASVSGGLLMGCVFAFDLYFENGSVCPSRKAGWISDLCLFGTLAGTAGSLLDSLLGATLQETLYSTMNQRILTDHSRRAKDEKGIERIGWGRDIVSNSTVNFLSGAMMAGFGWWWSRRWYV